MATKAELTREVEYLRNLCAAAYQMAGVVGAPVRFLDALSDAACGEAASAHYIEKCGIDDLLPVDLHEFDEIKARVPVEFVQHEGDAEGWSEWVTPNPGQYWMKCCGCDLVHEAQFRVALFEPRPSHNCSISNDPDVQAQFRMRRAVEDAPAL